MNDQEWAARVLPALVVCIMALAYCAGTLLASWSNRRAEGRRTMHVGHITESWGDQFGWEAGCKCGWRGPLREQERQAIQDLRGHRTGAEP